MRQNTAKQPKMRQNTAKQPKTLQNSRKPGKIQPKTRQNSRKPGNTAKHSKNTARQHPGPIPRGTTKVRTVSHHPIPRVPLPHPVPHHCTARPRWHHRVHPSPEQNVKNREIHALGVLGKTAVSVIPGIGQNNPILVYFWPESPVFGVFLARKPGFLVSERPWW